MKYFQALRQHFEESQQKQYAHYDKAKIHIDKKNKETKLQAFEILKSYMNKSKLKKHKL